MPESTSVIARRGLLGTWQDPRWLSLLSASKSMVRASLSDNPEDWIEACDWLEVAIREVDPAYKPVGANFSKNGGCDDQTNG